MIRCRILAVLTLAFFASTTCADTFSVTVKATDIQGQPVAKAELAMFWNVKDGVMSTAGDKPLLTGADGKALLRVDNWKEKRPVMVLSADRTLGAIVGVSKEDDGKEVAATLRPTVRVKGRLQCTELGFKPEWANTTVTADGFRAFFTQDITTAAKFEFVLPAGKYTFSTYGTDIEQINQKVTLSPDQPLLDLGSIDCKGGVQAKLKGKLLPNWIITDARGIKPDSKLSDYKGKWVYLEFWGHWCGPCCAGSLPELIEFYEAHADERDKFEVISIHAGSKTFADLDPKLTNIKKKFWKDKNLPFPILLDTATNETCKLYGITHFPTGLLIDPQGKLVGEVQLSELEAKLRPVSVASKWARYRDLQINVHWSFEPKEYTLDKFSKIMKRWTGCDLDLDKDAVKASGLDADAPLAGVLIGTNVTLKSIEEVLLAPHGLGFEPSTDGKKLLITKRQPTTVADSYFEKLHHKELNERLDRRPTDKEQKEEKPLEIKDQPLLDAMKLIAQEYDLCIALDAKAMRDNTLDASKKVSASVGPGDLRVSLTKMLDPLGLTVEVRHETVFVTPKKK